MEASAASVKFYDAQPNESITNFLSVSIIDLHASCSLEIFALLTVKCSVVRDQLDFHMKC